MSGFLLWTIGVFVLGLATMHQIHINRQMKAKDEAERLEADRIRRWNSGVEAARGLWI
jgi:hypothetical protein